MYTAVRKMQDRRRQESGVKQEQGERVSSLKGWTFPNYLHKFCPDGGCGAFSRRINLHQALGSGRATSTQKFTAAVDYY
jgi:hypothetical protein